MKFSSFVDRIGGEASAAWDLHAEALKAKAAGKDVIVLSIGDPDLSTPTAVTDQAIKSMLAGDTHYAAVNGREPLRRAIADKHSNLTGQPFGPENVCVYAGAQNALYAAATCLVEHGDEVIVPEPCYVTYEATIKGPGADWVLIPQPSTNGFRLNPDDIARAVTDRTKAIFIVTPSNPTGVMLNHEELTAISDIAKKHDLWVVSDEVYGALTFDEPHISIAGLPGMAERTVTVSSLSKAYAMTGWRLGWAIGPSELMEHMARLSLCMLYGMPGFIQEAATTALTECDADVDFVRETFRRRRDLTVDRLSKVPGLSVLSPSAGMFLMMDVRKTGLSAREFCVALFHEVGVCVLDASPFGPSTEGYVRISFASSDDELIDACKRIETFVRQRNDTAA